MPRLRPDDVKTFAKEATTLIVGELWGIPAHSMSDEKRALLAIGAVELVAQRHQRRLRRRERDAIYEAIVPEMALVEATMRQVVEAGVS